MVAHSPIDPGLLAVHRAGERPIETLGAQIFAFLLGDVLARRQIVPAAKMPVAGAGQDRATDGAILPEVDPGLRNLVGRRLVEDVRLGGVVQRDIGDPVALLVIDGQNQSPSSWGDPVITSPRLRGEVGIRAYAGFLVRGNGSDARVQRGKTGKQPLTLTLSPQAGRGRTGAKRGRLRWAKRSKDWRGLSRRRSGKTFPRSCSGIRSSCCWIRWVSSWRARSGPRCANCGSDWRGRPGRAPRCIRAAGPPMIHV